MRRSGCLGSRVTCSNGRIAYAQIQASLPQILAYALMDSPSEQEV